MNWLSNEDSLISTQQSAEGSRGGNTDVTDTLLFKDGKFFKIKSIIDKNKIIATHIVICGPNCKEIKWLLSLTSNFKSHLKRRYDQSVIH